MTVPPRKPAQTEPPDAPWRESVADKALKDKIRNAVDAALNPLGMSAYGKTVMLMRDLKEPKAVVILDCSISLEAVERL